MTQFLSVFDTEMNAAKAASNQAIELCRANNYAAAIPLIEVSQARLKTAKALVTGMKNSAIFLASRTGDYELATEIGRQEDRILTLMSDQLQYLFLVKQLLAAQELEARLNELKQDTGV